MKIRFFLICVFISVIGCESIPTPGDNFYRSKLDDNNVARVYFYRPKTLVMRVVETNLFINGVPEIVLSSGTYEVKNLIPGEYSFKAKIKPSDFGNCPHALDCSASEFSYYMKGGESYFIAWYPRNTLSKDKYQGMFIKSDIQNPDTVMEGLLSDIQAEFGVVDPKFAEEEIARTRLSKSIVDAGRI